MNRKVLVAAVAAALTAPAAFAQSSVTIGGTLNIMWDHVKAGNSTGGANDLRSHDRVRDGAGSNIRFTVIEDLGGGNSAFVQVESAVVANSDTRANAIGAQPAGTPATTGWGNRNTGIGIRSKAAGRFLIGVWDVHYHEHYSIDPGWIIVNSGSSTLGLMNTFGNAGLGAIGARYSNTMRWDSPNWGGFQMVVAYARPNDAAPINTTTGGAGDIRDGKKNRAWNFAPQYTRGGLSLQYSYLSDKDGFTTAALNPGGGALPAATQLWKITSNRLGARYKFANGLGLGAIWDASKVSNQTPTVASSLSIKRNVWAFPVTYEFGNHHLYATYSRARDWRGQVGNVDVGTQTNNTSIGAQPAGTLTYGSNTGANMWNMGYNYKLSQRTNLGVSYNRIRNDALVAYDFFANGSTNAAVGADPRQLAFNLRHTF